MSELENQKHLLKEQIEAEELREKLVVTFHFTDDKQELSYEDTLEMIENHKYLMDCVNDPETNVVDSSVATKMKENILSEGNTDPDFFQ